MFSLRSSRTLRSNCSWSRSFLQQRLQPGQRSCPAVSDHFVIPAPALAFFEAGLLDPNVGAIGFGPHGDMERHRADRLPIGWKPIGIRDEKSLRRMKLHHRSAKHPAQPSQHVVAEVGHWPFDRGTPRAFAAWSLRVRLATRRAAPAGQKTRASRARAERL